MVERKKTKPKNPSFTDEQIRAKALEIWQKRNKVSGSSEDDWNQAIEELEIERSFVKKIQRQTRLASQGFWNWTGFKEKKLWDILQLLGVPIVLATLGIWLQIVAKDREDNQQRDIKERERIQQESVKRKDQELADDRAKQENLSQYLDQITTLLRQGLLTSRSGSETFAIAQYKTVIALQSLNSRRQQSVIQFLEATSLNSLDGTKGLLYRARMYRTDLRNGDLSGCTIRKANISLSRLSGIDLSGCTLKGSILNGSDLTKANLGGIDLSETQLVSTGLVNSDLRIANLIRANFDKANLTGANLAGANLTEAKNLTDEQLSAAKLCHTTLPDYSSLDSDRNCNSVAP